MRRQSEQLQEVATAGVEGSRQFDGAAVAGSLMHGSAFSTGCGNLRWRCLRGLTFELSGRQRQDARPGLAKMYRVPPARARWPAVGAPLERGVRPHSLSLGWKISIGLPDGSSISAC